MFHLHYGNRLEDLATGLGAWLSEAPEDVFEPRIVVVPNPGVGRWLSLRLARQLGICANVRFPLPAAFVWDIFHAVLEDRPDAGPWSVSVLPWRILDALDALDSGPDSAPVRAWLGEGDAARRVELATRIAQCFDQYLLYRPDWVRCWERGGDCDAPAPHADWQARLWRLLAGQGRGEHWAAVYERFNRVMGQGALPESCLPDRLALFGVSALSPGYLAVLQALSEHVEVDLFLPNPCREYWADLASPRGRVAREQGGPGPDHRETGNALLASLGGQGAEYFEQIQDLVSETEEHYGPPGRQCLLHAVQQDILDLVDRGAIDAQREPVAMDDDSIQVHVCHSPLREVEVLHDRLRALFEDNPELQPSDVIVLSPDMSIHGPFVEAVFGAVSGTGTAAIPFSIADAAPPDEGPPGRFLALMELAGGRLPADAVMDLLEVPEVHRRFGLEDTDLQLITRWVRETGIRWGRDGPSRVREGLPDCPEHTWTAGLDRLLLGYAMPREGGQTLFSGIAPYDQVEGAGAEVLGRFAQFTTQLFSLQEALGEERGMDQWNAFLQQTLDRFFKPEGALEAQFQPVRQALASIARHAALAGYTDRVPASVVLRVLRQEIQAVSMPGRFLSGGVTFASLQPMRSLPFAVVCVIGMNDGAFPRIDQPVDFDLMAAAPRPGDRSRREDDRHLFLQTLLSARRWLYFSYTGRDQRDNSELPPSTLLLELLDYIERGFELSDGHRLRNRLMVVHPLQPFSRRYFEGDETLFSYDRSLCEAARIASGGGKPPVFLPAPLPGPGPEWLDVDLRDLVWFLYNPARFLIRDRLRVVLAEGEGALESEEPFSLDYFEDHDLRAWLLDLALQCGDTGGVKARARALGLLPHGAVGDAVLEAERRIVMPFAANIAARLKQPLPPEDFELHLGAFRLHGRLQGLQASGLALYRAEEVKPRHRITHWLGHLVLNALRPPGVACHSQWLGLDETVMLAPVDDAAARLEDLLGIYREGLSGPAPFFPKSAWEYALAVAGDRPDEDALKKARGVWFGNPHTPYPESADPYFRLAFGERDVIDARFGALARRVFGPCLEHMG